MPVHMFRREPPKPPPFRSQFRTWRQYTQEECAPGIAPKFFRFPLMVCVTDFLAYGSWLPESEALRFGDQESAEAHPLGPLRNGRGGGPR